MSTLWAGRHIEKEVKRKNVTHTASCKNRFTLYIVISAVGDDDIMMIGNMFSVQKWLWGSRRGVQSGTYWLYALAWEGRRMARVQYSPV